MRAAYIDALGAPSGIHWGELPDPTPGSGQVLVKVETVAVNAVDTYLRSGRWRTEVAFPLAVGRDLVGTVVALGAEVDDLRLGEWVWTNSAGYGGRNGATAELVPVDRDRLYRLPPEADPVAFVAAVHPGATAHGALLGRGRLQPEETVAVVGANGAVGMCLVQVGAARGAEVIAVVRHPQADERLRALGAEHVVVAEAGEAPTAAAAAAAAAAGGVDIVVDTTGQVDVAAVPAHLNPRGRILLIAGRGRAELDLWPFEIAELQLLGFVMSAMTVEELAAAAEWINSTWPERPLTVPVGQVLGLQDAAHAHALLEAGRLPRMPDGTIGRLILRP